MTWEKKSPDKIGYWVRLNAINRPQIHYVTEVNGELTVNWGWKGDEGRGTIKDLDNKLSYFYWTPLTNFPNETEINQRG